ncbi:hypothetical protein U9M48_001842 [Paspalum notatum var. saurae]|uniref:NB-ARC domain-containing protein n=1 Tax=Paspalum notatum var. saurae TaxID=547442 RepID=A0AAQ3PPK8_PASNO
MASAGASDEEHEQGLAESVPSDSEQQEEETEDGDQKAPAASDAYEQEASEIKEELRSLVGRISAVLEAGGPRSDRQRRGMAFLKMELTTFIVVVPPSLPDNPIDGTLLSWLRGLLDYARLINSYLPGSHTPLRRATQCFRSLTWTSDVDWFWVALMLFSLIEHPCRYRRGSLLVPDSDHGQPQPQPHQVGINRPAKKILRWLVPPKAEGETGEKRLRVMAIVGPVGVGKTTLARELRSRLCGPAGGGFDYFQHNVMVQASRGHDRNELLLREILSQVSDHGPAPALSSLSQPETMSLLVNFVSERLQNKRYRLFNSYFTIALWYTGEDIAVVYLFLLTMLHACRYFIIIDDIWKESDWLKMKDAFPINNLGSLIVVTTRFTSTARACCSHSDGLVHEMKPLNQMDSERLLLAKACSPTDGCPLPVVNVKPQEEDEAEEHKRFEEQAPHPPKRFEQALSSDFGDPDDRLWLPCLYMSMFPYGYKFDLDRLKYKWECEGLISYRGGEREMLMSELVDMNVITCSAAEDSNHNNLDEAETRQLHVNHFVHQLLASKSAETGFVFTSATLYLMAASAPRRLALHHPDPNIPSLLETMDLSQTRSLAVSGAVTRIPLDMFLDLVVLDLDSWENLKDEDLLHICKMSFLRYLSVRNTQVSKLPTEIKELRALESLDVSYTHICTLPKEIKELWRLESLDVSYTHMDELPLEVLKLPDLVRLDLRGTRIRQLPKQIVGLRSLTFLLVDSVETRVPEDVRHLKSLETLATVDLTQHPASFVRALGDIQMLEVLAVTWSFHQSTDKDYFEALLSSIQKWKMLQSLTIHCGHGCSMEFLGSQMDRPPMNLEKFKVTAGRFASVPRWLHWLKRLAFLQITVCKQGKGDLEILGGLPSLQRLILGLDFIPSEAVVIDNTGFHQLQKLSIDCPMPWLTFSEGAMGRLTYLQLKFCATPAKQDRVPSDIINLRRITEIALCYDAPYINCPSVKMTVDAVRKQADQHRNPINLFINGIEQDDVQAVDEVTEIATGSSSRTGAGAGEDDADQAVHWDATAAVQSEITEAE